MTRKRKCHSKSNSFVAAAEQVCLSGSLSVCLSVTSRCSIVAVGRIDVVLGTEASFDHCIFRKFRYLQKQGHFALELFSELRT